METELKRFGVEELEHVAGMTLRDLFAGLVLHGFISHRGGGPSLPKTCYAIADDMLKARGEIAKAKGES